MMVEVYAIELIEEDKFNGLKDQFLSQLPDSSRANYLNIKSKVVYQRSLLGETLARKIISLKTKIRNTDIEIHKSEKGKPYLVDIPNLYYNITHSGNWVAVGFSGKEIGIDVEKMKKTNIKIAERFFSKSENEVLINQEEHERAACFFDFWTLKESYLKLLGKGLTKSLGSFSVLKNGSEFMLFEGDHRQDNIYFKQYFLQEGYKLSVCASENVFSDDINIQTINDLLNKN